MPKTLETDEETREKLSRDLQIVSKKVLERLSGHEPNLQIIEEDTYLNPITGQEVPFLWDPTGEVTYYKNIRDTLEQILMYGKKTIGRINQAPDYVSKFYKYAS